jgi:hypothetical protein
MYQVYEYDSGITYKIGEPHATKLEALEYVRHDASRYESETKGEVIWNKNNEGFKVSGLKGSVRMWIKEVE